MSKWERITFVGDSSDHLISEFSIESGFDAVRYLALRIRVWPEQINYILSQGVESFYRQGAIPKSNGDMRPLMIPTGWLRFVQRRIDRRIFRSIIFPHSVHGYVRGRSIVSNAYAHRTAEHMYVLDLDNAFGSVFDNQVVRSIYGMEIDGFKIGWATANLITQLTTVSDPRYDRSYNLQRLPQGTPTSPALFNLVCGKLDRRLSRFAERIGGTYTRYVDNIAISARRPITPKERHIIRKIVLECDFDINERKTGMMHSTRNSVLHFPGLILSDGRPALSKRKKRNLRAAIYFAAMHGEEERLRGLVSYAHQVYGSAIPRQLLGVVPSPQLLIPVEGQQ